MREGRASWRLGICKLQWYINHHMLGITLINHHMRGITLINHHMRNRTNPKIFIFRAEKWFELIVKAASSIALPTNELRV